MDSCKISLAEAGGETATIRRGKCSTTGVAVNGFPDESNSNKDPAFLLFRFFSVGGSRTSTQDISHSTFQ